MAEVNGVFKGGGAKGLLYVGALEAAELVRARAAGLGAAPAALGLLGPLGDLGRPHPGLGHGVAAFAPSLAEARDW